MTGTISFLAVTVEVQADSMAAKKRKPARQTTNIKTHPRVVMPFEQFEANRAYYEDLAKKAKYIGIYYHKKNPEAFGLIRESRHKPDKSLCDDCDPPIVSSRSEGQDLLRKGILNGLISANSLSDPENNPWPQHVWAVTPSGVPVEAAYDRRGGQTGYHGYPIPDDNSALYDEILKRWPK
jgi:hypothetical protein